MGLSFYDYDGLQPKITPPKHFSLAKVAYLNNDLRVLLQGTLFTPFLHHIFTQKGKQHELIFFCTEIAQDWDDP